MTAHNPKIRTLDDLAVQLDAVKAAGQRVVLAHGVFDLLHMGHIRHLEQAKCMGDVLVVTLTQDQFVNKGPHRPAFSQDLRAEALAALQMVDFVAVNRWPQAAETIRLLKPNIYVKGQEYRQAELDITGGITPEAEAVQAVGGEIRFTEDIVFSSSHLLNRFFSPFDAETEQYLECFQKAHSSAEVIAWLEKAAALRPVVVGEAIIDEYVFCDAIGKSTKDPVLAVLQQEVEAYVGGSLAVANHLAGLCDSVTLITQLGDQDRAEAFVRQHMRPNVHGTYLTKTGSPTIHKRRIVERYTSNKLLELYVMNDRVTTGADAQALVQALAADAARSELLLVTDYGHGMLMPEAIARLWDARFLAVNAQSNAGNRGFNPISKYRRADYVCLANHEVDIETRQRGGNEYDQVRELAQHVACPRFTVTRGKRGTLHYDTVDGFCEAPALATRVVDRVGAGDAVFALTSLLLRLGAPWDIVAFLGNVAGAQAVAELGNRSALDRLALSQHVIALLK